MTKRDQILGTQDLKRATVDVPEWGCAVVVRALTYQERARYFRRRAALPVAGDAPTAGDYHEAEGILGALAVALAALDDDGVRLFTDDDVAALEQRDPEALLRLHSEILALSGMRPREEAEDLGESQGTTTASGSSNSACNSDDSPTNSSAT
jgi:hypothetical protein